MLTTPPNNSLTRLRALSAHLRMDGQAPSLATRGDCAATSLSLDGKVVLVTGGGDGIGGGMVRGFSEAGATVFYCDLKEHTDPPPGATFIHCDVRDRAAISRTVAQVARASGGAVDVLCNNVGVVLEAGTPLHETSDDAWDTTLAVNLTSYFKFSQACIPLMLKNGSGSIINTSSVQGLQSMPGVCAYAASKGAVSSLTRQMAVEYARQGIRASALVACDAHPVCCLSCSGARTLLFGLHLCDQNLILCWRDHQRCPCLGCTCETNLILCWRDHQRCPTQASMRSAQAQSPPR